MEDKVKFICQFLQDLYPSPKVPLNHSNAYTLLIAVLLSAQSTDKKVNELTPDLFKLASSPSEMIELGEENIYKRISQLGLARRKATHIFNLSKMLIHLYNSKVPSTFSELESLPGVGHKTASVVLAQFFGIPTFPVDTHIHRLAQRWELTTGQSVTRTEFDLKRLFPKSNWNDLHLQMIFYGREYCTARGCDGRRCPLCCKLFPSRTHPVQVKKA